MNLATTIMKKKNPTDDINLLQEVNKQERIHLISFSLLLVSIKTLDQFQLLFFLMLSKTMKVLQSCTTVPFISTSMKSSWFNALLRGILLT